MFTQIITSTEVIIPALTSYYGNFPLSGGNLISVGIQNLGFQTNVYPTQLMITSNTNVFFQIDNQKSSPVTILIYGVVDNAAAAFGPIYGQGIVSIG